MKSQMSNVDQLLINKSACEQKDLNEQAIEGWFFFIMIE